LTYWQSLRDSGNKFIITNYTFAEIMTWLSVKKGKKTAVEFGNYLIDNENIIQRQTILAEDEIVAWQWFGHIKGRQSFFDCVGFAVMKRLGIKTVFTFDKHFEEAGFKVEPGI